MYMDKMYMHKMSPEEMYLNKMYTDKMSPDKMYLDKTLVDKMWFVWLPYGKPDMMSPFINRYFLPG